MQDRDHGIYAMTQKSAVWCDDSLRTLTWHWNGAKKSDFQVITYSRVTMHDGVRYAGGTEKLLDAGPWISDFQLCFGLGEDVQQEKASGSVRTDPLIGAYVLFISKQSPSQIPPTRYFQYYQWQQVLHSPCLLTFSCIELRE